MPDFGNPFSGLKNDRKLDKEELIRAVRFAVSAEYEAVQLYTQIAEATNDELASAVMLEVANEERVHAGEFLQLLKELDPEEAKFYEEGTKEVEDKITEVKAKTAARRSAQRPQVPRPDED